MKFNKNYLDFSKNAFNFPFVEGHVVAYYNAIIDLIAVFDNEKKLKDDIFTTQECAHRLMAFNPMHCYMRLVASYVYKEIMIWITRTEQSKVVYKLGDIYEQKDIQIWQIILDSLSDAVAFVQELIALFGTANALRKRGWDERRVIALENRYIHYQEKTGMVGFEKLYGRFKYATSRLGGNKYGTAIALYAMSSPWFFPVSQKLEALATEIAKAIKENPIFSPILRLNRLISIIEECPYVDFPNWKSEERDCYIRLKLKEKYGHVVNRCFEEVACCPKTNQCFLHAQNENSKQTTMGQCFDIWQNMCTVWQDSFGKGILTGKEPFGYNCSQPVSFPTFFYADDKIITYGDEPSHKLSLLFFESIRQQICKRQGLKCPIKMQCKGYTNCEIAVLLNKLWHKTKTYYSNQWAKPECPYNKI